MTPKIIPALLAAMMATSAHAGPCEDANASGDLDLQRSAFFDPKFNSAMAVEVAWLRGINVGLAAARSLAGQAIGPDRERSYLLLVQEICRRRPTRPLSAAAGLAASAVLDWAPDMSVDKFDVDGLLDRVEGRK